jgi:hypothetical protein
VIVSTVPIGRLPNSLVVMRAVIGPVPGVAAAGIVVRKEATPAPSVETSEGTMAGIPGTVIVKRTDAPSSGRPSGSVTATRTVSEAGSRLFFIR